MINLFEFVSPTPSVPEQAGAPRLPQNEDLNRLLDRRWSRSLFFKAGPIGFDVILLSLVFDVSTLSRSKGAGFKTGKVGMK